MSERLLVRFHPQIKSKLEWRFLTAKGTSSNVAVESGDIEQFSSIAQGKRVIFLLPGRQLFFSQADLPQVNGRNLTAALSYALEDQLAEDVDLMHFVSAPRMSNGLIPVVAIRRELLYQVQQTLQTAGVNPYWVLAEPMVLPIEPQSVSLLLEDNRAQLRLSEYLAFECRSDQLLQLLPALLKEQGVESDVKIRVWGKESSPELISQMEKANYILDCQPEKGLAALCSIPEKRPQFNLLQGLTGNHNEDEGSGNWWPAFILILAAFALHMGISISQYQQIKDEEQKIAEKTEALFCTTFPKVKRVVEPLVQAKQLLKQRGSSHSDGDSSLLNLLVLLQKVQQENGALIFNGIEYRQDRLQVRLSGQSVVQIEQFKQEMESNGDVEVEILTTVSRNDMIDAQVKIQVRSS